MRMHAHLNYKKTLSYCLIHTKNDFFSYFKPQLKFRQTLKQILLRQLFLCQNVKICFVFQIVALEIEWKKTMFFLGGEKRNKKKTFHKICFGQTKEKGILGWVYRWFGLHLGQFRSYFNTDGKWVFENAFSNFTELIEVSANSDDSNRPQDGASWYYSDNMGVQFVQRICCSDLGTSKCFSHYLFNKKMPITGNKIKVGKFHNSNSWLILTLMVLAHQKVPLQIHPLQ